MAQVPGPHYQDAAATAERARLMREDARSVRERNQQLLRANEEMRVRLGARLQAPAPDGGPGR